MAIVNKKTEPQTKRRRKKVSLKTEMAIRYIQFSKKITVFILAFWGVYRMAQLVVGIIKPELANALVKLSSGIDTVAITFGLAYTGNSIVEKGLNVHKEIQRLMYLNTENEENEENAENDESTETISTENSENG